MLYLFAMVESHSDRRIYPRLEVAWPVHVEAPIRLVLDTRDSDPGRRFYLRGTTINVSRGGALVRLDHTLKPDADTTCSIEFLDGYGLAKPGFRFAAVIRSEETPEGHQSALRFLSPLTVLSVDDEGASTVADDPRRR